MGGPVAVENEDGRISTLATGPADYILIAGPTASGKSALALDLAHRKGGVIINADSMQIYEGLPILTAQPTQEELRQADHRLYGEVRPGQAWSVAEWLEAVRAIAAELHSNGRIAILCGGTGLYFKAALDGISEVPPIDPQVRRRWREFAAQSPDLLHGELAQRDAQGAASLNPHDTQRLVRALEVIDGTGQPLSHWHGREKRPLMTPHMKVEQYLIMPERSVLHERINARFEQMIEAGAVDEARAFLARGLTPSLPAMKAIGLREIGAHLGGEISLAQASERARTATRQYAKRQMTWFRNQTGTGWQVIVQ